MCQREVADTVGATHDYSTSNLWREIADDARKGWSRDHPKDDRVQLAEAVWFCAQAVVKNKAAADVGDVLPVLGSLLRVCRPGAAVKAGDSFDHGGGLDIDPEAGGLLGLVYAPVQALCLNNGTSYALRCSGARAGGLLAGGSAEGYRY